MSSVSPFGCFGGFVGSSDSPSHKNGLLLFLIESKGFKAELCLEGGLGLVNKDDIVIKN